MPDQNGPGWEEIRRKLETPLGLEQYNGRRLRVTRLVVYEGDGAMVAAAIARSLQEGRRQLRGYSITVHQDRVEDLGPLGPAPLALTQAEVDSLEHGLVRLAAAPVFFVPEDGEEVDGFTPEEAGMASRALGERDQLIQDLLQRLRGLAR